MKSLTEATVRRRAGHRCEYCRLPESASNASFQIDHVIARKHGGITELTNLSLACGRCNRRKETNLSGIDPSTGEMERLFDPRRQSWADHFRVEGAAIVGITPVGRTTVVTLDLNHAIELSFRSRLAERRLWPGPMADRASI